MQKLAKREEQIMQVFWKLEKAFIKEIIPEMPDPKPHYNSVATMVKILEEKGFLDHDTIGNIYHYYPKVSREDYQKGIERNRETFAAIKPSELRDALATGNKRAFKQAVEKKAGVDEGPEE